MLNSMKESISKLSDRVKAQRGMVSTEEATKNAFIMPFIQIMGYDVFDPSQVIPEYIADIGIKRGERVDYAIMREGKAEILIECKSSNTVLDVYNESQLFRYFTCCDAQFAILTNGIEYKFYTDLEAPNKMDEKPFLEFSILHPDKIDYIELVKLSKDRFDAASIRKSADHLKKVTAIRQIINSELKNPSADFVKLIFRKISSPGAVFSDKVRIQISPLVKSVIDDTINDIVKSSLSDAVGVTEAISNKIYSETAPSQNSEIVTTPDELEGYAIIKAILHDKIPLEKVIMTDWKSYCAINFDGSGHKPICRLYFNNPQNYRIGLFDEKTEEKIQISCVNDIFKYSGRIVCSALKYVK